MTLEQVNLVQQSFAKVAPISEQAAVLFYDRLFEVAPSAQAMFPADMTEQRKKWTAAYGTLSGYMISEAYGKAQAASSTQAAE